MIARLAPDSESLVKKKKNLIVYVQILSDLEQVLNLGSRQLQSE